MIYVGSYNQGVSIVDSIFNAEGGSFGCLFGWLAGWLLVVGWLVTDDGGDVGDDSGTDGNDR